jgi:CRP/FNR family transcriptional regulator, cyclic AMP receptor protein
MQAPRETVSMGRLADIALLRPLGPDRLGRLEARCSFVRYDANELIIDFDDASSDVYFVLTGKVRILYRAGTGKEVILGELGDGEFFGELAAIDGLKRSANVTALHRSELCRMPGGVFDELLDGPAFNRCLLRVLSGRIRNLNARLAEQAFLQVKYRLFAELIRLSAPRPGGGETRAISPPPFHHDIANRIGARREVVSRELSALEKAGLIDKTRGALVLRDPGELNRRISAALEEPAS